MKYLSLTARKLWPRLKFHYGGHKNIIYNSISGGIINMSGISLTYPFTKYTQVIKKFQKHYRTNIKILLTKNKPGAQTNRAVTTVFLSYELKV